METIWPIKSKVLTMGPLPEMFVNPLYYSNSQETLNFAIVCVVILMSLWVIISQSLGHSICDLALMLNKEIILLSPVVVVEFDSVVWLFILNIVSSVV